jgi:transposase
MTRAYGRCPTHERLIDYVPRNHWMTTTFLAALRTTGLSAPLVVDGAITGEIFLKWVREHLAPTLLPGDIVVMDNLACHKIAGVREAIQAVGAEVLYLPPYSPDWNPIELTFAKIKQILRRRKPRTKEECDRLCGESLDWFPPAECQNYIRHCGYRSQQRN